MNPAQFRKFLETEAEKLFSGWDFSYLNGRLVEAPLEWSYPSLLLGLVRGSPAPKSLLDMGTGGGEFFSTLAPFPPYTAATEAYPPNVPIARERLEPLGAQVFEIDEIPEKLPFADGQFDRIANRHEYYDPADVARILASGGQFVTQQVGDQNDRELKEMLGADPEPGGMPDAAWNLDFAVKAIEKAGLEIIEARECTPTTRIFDAGAIVYYFTALPWEIPDFSVEKYFDPLTAIHERIQADGYIETTLHRFLIRAVKNA